MCDEYLIRFDPVPVYFAGHRVSTSLSALFFDRAGFSVISMDGKKANDVVQGLSKAFKELNFCATKYNSEYSNTYKLLFNLITWCKQYPDAIILVN